MMKKDSMDVEVLSRLYSEDQRPRRRRPESAPVSTSDWAMVPEAECAAADLSHFFDKTQAPRIPPAISRLPKNSFRKAPAVPEVVPPPPIDTTKKKSFHPNRGETECQTADSRHRKAWARMREEKQLREDKDKLRRLTAESVRRAKENFSAFERENLDRYKLKLLDEKNVILSPRQMNNLKKMSPRKEKTLELAGDSPYHIQKAKKPPIPRRRAKAVSSVEKKEEQQVPPDDDLVVAEVEPLPDEEVEVRVRCLDGTWMNLKEYSTSTVKDLKTALAFKTNNLASEFQLRQFDESMAIAADRPLGALLADDATVGEAVAAFGTCFAVELTELGAQLKEALSGEIKEAPPKKMKPRSRSSRSSTSVKIDPNRPIATPAEWAKRTEELRGASRAIKGDRNWSRSKAECTRHHRKLIDIERSLEERMQNIMGATPRRSSTTSSDAVTLDDDDHSRRRQILSGASEQDECFPASLVGGYFSSATTTIRRYTTRRHSSSSQQQPQEEEEPASSPKLLFRRDQEKRSPDLRQLQSAFVALPRRPSSKSSVRHFAKPRSDWRRRAALDRFRQNRDLVPSPAEVEALHKIS